MKLDHVNKHEKKNIVCTSNILLSQTFCDASILGASHEKSPTACEVQLSNKVGKQISDNCLVWFCWK